MWRQKKRSVSTFRTHILDLGSTSRARTTAGSDKASVRASITGRDLDSGKDKRVPRKSVFGGVRGANKVRNIYHT